MIQPQTTSLDEVCDDACLSADQRLIILTCTSIDCRCGAELYYARSRIRLAKTESIADVTSRIDLATSLGRVGGVYRTGPVIRALGGWLATTAGPVNAIVGSHAYSVGTGLVHGSASGFGRSALSRANGVDASIRLRPWTSTWTDFAMSGVAVAFQPDPSLSSFQAIASWSQPFYSFENVPTIGVAALFNTGSILFGATALKTTEDVLGSVIMEVSSPVFQTTAEIAFQSKGDLAAVVVGSRLLPNGKITGAIRWAHPDFKNDYASAVSSRSSAGNEAGILLGVNIRKTGRWNVEALVDFHSVLSRSYGSPLPSMGMELLADGQYIFNRSTSINLRLRHELDDEGWNPPDTSIRIMVERRRSTMRAELVHNPTREIRLRVRADARIVSYTGGRGLELGSLLYGELQWTPSDFLRCTARYTIYAAPSIDAAAYTLEVPITGMMQTVAGTGQGSRLLLSARVALTHWSAFQLMVLDWNRVSHTRVFRAAIQLDISV